MKRPYFFIQAFFFFFITASHLHAEQKNGFDLDGGIIDHEKILFGGPPRDGIPAINSPKFIAAKNNRLLRDDDRVLGIAIDGVAKAYPIRILNWHELVNDTINDTHFVVTYCPLCGTGVVFNSAIEGQILNFGVSGLLYNSDVLLYDRESESLWSQILGKGVTGTMTGTELTRIPVTHTTWQSWQEKYPESLILSQDTGYFRNYSHNPYGDYASSDTLYFPVENRANSSLHLKETVMGVQIGDKYKAYPFSLLQKQGDEQFQDTFNGETITILWNEKGFSAAAYKAEGGELSSMQAFWFAWYAFHPDTEIYEAQR